MQIDGNGQSLADWAIKNASYIEKVLVHDGHAHLRGFRVAGVEEFESAARTLCGPLIAGYGDLPTSDDFREGYFATRYPEQLEIKFHNEASHTDTWPSRQMFYCVREAATGGEWTIVDGRVAVDAMPSEIVSQVSASGFLYRRRFIPSLDADWRQLYSVASYDELLLKMRARGYGVSIQGEDVVVSYRAPGIINDQRDATPRWFNQVLLHHRAALAQEVDELLSALYAPEDYPRTVYFGDGKPIPDDWIHRIESVLADCGATIPAATGDVLLVNNLTVAHGRRPYTGDRVVRVALGRGISAGTRSEPSM